MRTTLRHGRNTAFNVTKAPRPFSDLVKPPIHLWHPPRRPLLITRCATDTLDAYIDKYSSLVSYLADNAPPGQVPPSDPAPPDLTSVAISLRIGVTFDSPGIGHNFGDVLIDVHSSSPYTAGQTVWAQFVGANPRNNLRLEDSFLLVEQLVSGSWQPVRSDSHPSTIYRWLRTNGLFGTSTVNISWTIEPGTPSGTYRLQYFGDSKPFIGSITSFTGTSSSFQVS